MEEVVTIEDSIVANYILNNSLTIEDGDWCYKLYSKDEIMAYKSDDDNTLEEAFYINIFICCWL